MSDDDRLDHGLIHLVRIYGEIDRAIKANPTLAGEVSFLLPAYADAGDAGVHWFDEYEQWTRRLVEKRGGDPETAFPNLEQAIIGLANLEPKGRMRARRLHAIGAAARTLPEVPDHVLAAAALGPRALEGIEDQDAAAKEFVALLRDDPIGTRDQTAALQVWWESVLAWEALPAADEVGPPPCSGGLVWVDVEGESEPVATLETVFEAKLSYEAAKKFCDPLRWTCFAFWCKMEDLENKGPLMPNGVRRYRESVSLECANEHTWLVVDLNFRHMEAEPGAPRVATTEYELAGAHPHVAVNEGTLEVVELSLNPPKVRVKSTKRLKFKGTFDGPAFASVMCHIGYLSYVEDLLCCAADPNWNAGFPGQIPRDKSAQKGPADSDPYFPGLTKYTIDRVATALEDCLDEYSKDVEAPGKTKEGSQTARTPAQHMANTYSRMLQEGAKVADIGLRGGRMSPGSPGRSRSGPGARSAASTGAGGAARSAVAEVCEDWAQLGKVLIRKWSAHASQIATKLDDARKYDADKMAADLATTASLAIETGARLTWETLDSATILCGGLDRPYIVESDEFSTPIEGAALALEGDLKSGFGLTLPASSVLVLTTPHGPGETRFKLRADATGRRAGTYRGKVRASTPNNMREVSVRIIVA